MKKRTLILFIFNSLIIINKISSKEKQILYKCGIDEYELIPEDAKHSIPIEKNSPLYSRRLDNLAPDGFKTFNIYFDFKNIEYEIELYNLTKYKDIYIYSIKKAIKTLESLLRVKPLIYNYYLQDEDITSLNITKWDKNKLGTEAYYNHNITMNSLGIDLIILGKFAYLGESTLANAGAKYREKGTGQPILGVVTINNNTKFDYSKNRSQEYFESIIIHEFTHILGFSNYYFNNYFKNIFSRIDAYGIKRNYINSTKVVEFAKKYFNCSDIDGVELEEYGGNGTVGSHWEARILLGDYMNGVIYTEEQVISEFTLALLEDSGYYKPNYYTGGLMRYGKNKGCAFVKERCVNSSHEINPFFENEFYDSINSYYSVDASCSSGRQSRTYHAWWLWNNIPGYYQYFKNSKYGGFPSADFCPVSISYFPENDKGYYIGHCSSKGSGEYGTVIRYSLSNGYTYHKSEELYSITGEMYSEHSYCFLSSLTKNNTQNLNYYSKVVRAICFESFCSNKSLTIKIHDDYIVCPRGGGKIEVEGYKGYFLCPDYNLICSGTVLCNDMFDCVDKKSEIKKESYYYDYEIKTSQNIEAAEIIDSDDINNYELAENGICPLFCKQCKENNKCIKCRNNYGLVASDNNEGKYICLSENELIIGYYKNNSIYYKCIENCDNCHNKTGCNKCKNNFTFYNNKCIEEIKNCKEYNSDNKCLKCINNYAFKEEDKYNCLYIGNFSEFYSKDEGISYYPCDGDNQEQIKKCSNCYFNKTINELKCYKCKNDYILIDNINTCHLNQTIENDHSYYYINQTHAKKCSNSIKNCDKCLNEKICTKCIKDFYLLNYNTMECVNINNINNIDEYYLDEKNTSYYLCKNYNYIKNCLKCLNKDSCLFCQNDFTFIDGNKTNCIEKETIKDKYIQDTNDLSNYIKCSNFINNCNLCNSSQCFLCNDGYIFINDNFTNCILKSSLNLINYFTDDDKMFYSCNEEKYKNNIKCKKLPVTTLLKLDSTILKEVKTFHENYSTIPKTNIKTLINTNSLITTIQNNNIIEKTFIKSELIINHTIALTIPTKSNTIISTPSIIVDNTYINHSHTIINIDSIISENIQVKSNIISTLSNNTHSNIVIPNTNLNSQIINNITNIPEIFSTLINNNINPETPKIIINTIFILQVQLINNILKVFLLSDFPIPKNYPMKLKTIIYDYKNLRNLQQEKGKNALITVYTTEDNDINKIVVFCSDNEFNKDNNIKRLEVQKIEIDNKKNNNLNINILDNNCLDTAKVEKKIKNEGGMDYSNIPPNYSISQYKIYFATKGCNFELLSNSKINQNKEINLKFKDDKSEIITFNCSLSQNNRNSILCKLYKNIDSNYILEDYIESNDQETITIIQSNKTDKLYLNCYLNPEKPNNSSKGGLKLGYIIVFVVLFILLVAGIIILSIFCGKCCKNRRKNSDYRNHKNKIIYEINTERKFNPY